MSKSMKAAINAGLSNVKISASLREEMVTGTSVSNREKVATYRDDKKKTLRRSFSVALAACLCILLSVPVLAVTFPGLRAVLSQINPEIAKILEPAEISVTDNGIQMKVIGAVREEDLVIVYLEIQDLTSDRVGKDMYLRDLDISGLTIKDANEVGRTTVKYDEGTETITMKLVISSPETDSGKVTLKINELENTHYEWRIFDSAIDLAAIDFSENTVPLELDTNKRHGGGHEDSALGGHYLAKGSVDLLKPNEMNLPVPGTEHAYITNMGFVDGYFHVQVRFPRNEIMGENYDWGQFYLTKDSLADKPLAESDLYGNPDVITTASFSFSVDENGNVLSGGEGHADYMEYIFEKKLSQEEIGAYNLLEEGFSRSDLIVGNWQTVFDLEPVIPKTADCDVTTGNAHITRLSISPLRIALFGTGTVNREREPMTLSITMENGEIFELDADTLTSEDSLKVEYFLHDRFDPENIEEIRLNGQVIDFK